MCLPNSRTKLKSFFVPIFCPFLNLLFHLDCTLKKIYLLTSSPCWGFAIHLLPPRAISQVRRKLLQNNLCLFFFSCVMVLLLLLLLTLPGRRRWHPELLAASSPLIHHWPAAQWLPCALGQSDSGSASLSTAQGRTPAFCIMICFLQWVCVCHSVSKPGAGFWQLLPA